MLCFTIASCVLCTLLLILLRVLLSSDMFDGLLLSSSAAIFAAAVDSLISALFDCGTFDLPPSKDVYELHKSELRYLCLLCWNTEPFKKCDPLGLAWLFEYSSR